MYKKCINICNTNCVSTKFLLKMKLSFVLLTAAGLQLAVANTYGQKITFSKQNVSLKNVLNELESKTGYNFIYNTDMIASSTLISLNLKNATIKEALDKSLINHPLTYTINGNTVVIVKRMRYNHHKKERL